MKVLPTLEQSGHGSSLLDAGAPQRLNQGRRPVVALRHVAMILGEGLDMTGGLRSQRIGQPTVSGAWPRQAMVAEGDQDRTSISERQCWSPKLMATIAKYCRKTPKSR